MDVVRCIQGSARPTPVGLQSPAIDRATAGTPLHVRALLRLTLSGALAQMAERCVGAPLADVEVTGSSPVGPVRELDGVSPKELRCAGV